MDFVSKISLNLKSTRSLLVFGHRGEVNRNSEEKGQERCSIGSAGTFNEIVATKQYSNM